MEIRTVITPSCQIFRGPSLLVSVRLLTPWMQTKKLKQGILKKGRTALLPRGGASASSPAITVTASAARSSAPEDVAQPVPRKLGAAVLLSRKRDYVAED